MTDFETIYKQALGLIDIKRKQAQKEGDSEEYLNMAYLALVESGEEITKQKLVSKAVNFFLSSDIGRDLKKPDFTKETTKICNYCKKDYPIGFFGITKNNSAQRQTIQPYCRDCAKIYFKEYFEKRKQQWNAMLKERYRKERDTLHDNFIKKRLRCYGWKTEDITPQVISHTRKELIIKGIKVHHRERPTFFQPHQ